MALVPFAGHKVGFWVVARGITAGEEFPEGVPVRVSGEPSVNRRALVVAAADPADRVLWGAVLHADGAALLMPWQGMLLAAIGPRAVLLGEDGGFLAERVFEAELATAWDVPGGLFLMGAGRAWLVDRELAPKWTRPLAGESFHLMGADERALRIAAMGRDDWREIVLDPRTGAEIASS